VALRQKKWHKNKSRDGNSNDESKRELFHGDLTTSSPATMERLVISHLQK
jgi:hypothetical protein